MNEERKISKILSLANAIAEYKVDTADVEAKISKIENKYGDFSIPLNLDDYPDDSDETVLNELNIMVHRGVCGKEILLKMAVIASNLYSERIESYKRKVCLIKILSSVIGILGAILIAVVTL